MTGVLGHKDVKPIIEKYFVVVVLVTGESPDKKHLENAGSDAVLKEIGGDKQGLPFFGFLDAKGKLIMNSIAPGKEGKPGSNVGCPYEPAEIGHFMAMLGKAAPKMTEAERTVIQTNFENLKKNAKPRP